MVSLTGYLLEYPVSYVPLRDLHGKTVYGGFLCGVPLNVFRVTLVLSSQDQKQKTNGYVALISSPVVESSSLSSLAPCDSPYLSHTQSLLQFSCPAVLNNQVAGLDPRGITERIKNRWKKRIEDLASSTLMWDEIRVSVERKTLDRVVL